MWNNTSLGADEESHKDGMPPKFLFGVHLGFHKFFNLFLNSTKKVRLF